MKKRAIGLLVLIMAVASFGSMNFAFAADESNAAIQAAADQFYAALNTLFTGDAGPMEALWSHADDVTYMGPDGIFQAGWAEVQADWKKQAEKKLGGKVTPEKMRITSAENMGITSNYEVGENIDANGNPVKVSIRATNVFRNEDGQWKMVGHHTDLLPYLVEETKS